MIEWLVAPPNPNETLKKLAAFPTEAPFSEEAIHFIHTLSQNILTDATARTFPEVMAVAHWFRKAHLNALKTRFENNYKRNQARGIVFHIAPGNVDTLFMYSWLLSLLMGNHNIVRLSQRRNEQISRLLNYIRTTIAEVPSLQQHNFILSYPHQDEITEQFSQHCDLRIVWGGDETVRHIQKIPLPPHAQDVGFRDRFSFAVFNAAFMNAANEKDFNTFIAQFYNDVFWFDQRACSSPRLVAWVGNDAHIQRARDRFWTAFTRFIKNRDLPACADEAIARSTVMMYWAAFGNCLEAHDLAGLGRFPEHVMLRALNDDIRRTHPGTGLLAEITMSSVDEIYEIISSKDQTVVAYGFEKGCLAEIQSKTVIDRICAPGMALHFDTVWDGVDFFDVFSRSR